MLTVIMVIVGSCLLVTILNIVLIVFLVLLKALMLTIVLNSKCIQNYGMVHNTNQLVDDSTNVVGSDNTDEMNIYLIDFQ